MAVDAPGESQCSVILAEDDESIRLALFSTLQKAGFFAVAVDSGENAIRQYKPLGWSANIVVTDGIMSGIDGFEVARYFSQLVPPVPVILITGFADYFASREDRPKNIVSILEKPVSGAALITTIERVYA